MPHPALLNPFPDLLLLGALAPFVLRIVIGGIFLWMSYLLFANKTAAAQNALLQRPYGVSSLEPYLTPLAPAVIWALVGAEVVLAVMFIVGWRVQYAALIGALVALKLLYFSRRYTEIAPYSPAFYILLFAVSLSLLFSGAGAFAIDLPL